MSKKIRIAILSVLSCMIFLSAPGVSQVSEKEKEIDRKVKIFLDDWKYKWRDMNIPEVDGQIMYDLIIKNGYTKALEVGTSTGRSAIWIAWALSKTGGKLITVEIDERRYKQAVENFKTTGLSEYIDARLADAHELVPELKESFDFVFIDADKDWYTNYAKAIVPKLEVNGCMTAHNVSDRSRGRRGRRSSGQGGAYLEYVRGLSNFETTIESSGGGLAISFKKREK
jgi:predicted O-methyltransferase YrrM